MRDPRKSRALVPRSLPRTATLRPAGTGFAGKVFVPKGRIRHVSPGRRTVRPVGDIELGRQAPEALEIVVAPGLLAENVHDKTAEIEQRPFGGAMSLAMFGRAAEILIELRFDFRADGLHLRRAVARADHKIVREGARCREIEHGDARSFLFLCGFDGQADALRQRFEFHRYRPCLRMYSSTRAETSPWMDWPRCAWRRTSVAETSLETFSSRKMVDLWRCATTWEGYSASFFASGGAIKSGGMTRRRASGRMPGRLAMMKSQRPRSVSYSFHMGMSRNASAPMMKKRLSPWPW